MLRQDFQLNLGVAEGELPRDEHGLDIAKIWNSVSAAIKDIKGWEVSEEVVLSSFSFAKYLMWVDLVQRTDQLRQSPVVKHLIDTPRDPYAEMPANSVTSMNRVVRRQYTECDLSTDVDACDPDSFHNSSYDEQLMGLIDKIVVAEGPVLDVVLARRISRAHGWQRTGARIQERVEQLARQAHKTTEEDVGTFYWPHSLIPGGDVEFRWPARDTQRSFDEVCLEELKALAVILDRPGLSDDEVLVAMARELGVLRLRAASRFRLEAALFKSRELAS